MIIQWQAVAASAATQSVESHCSLCAIIWQLSRKVGESHPNFIVWRQAVTLAHAHVLLGRAELYRLFGEKEKAVDDYLNIVALQRNNILANLRLAEFCHDKRKFELAILCLQRAQSGGYLHEDVFIKIAKIQTQLGDHAGALATVHAGVQTISSSSKLHSMRGYMLIELGSIDEGMRQLSKAIELDEANISAYLNRAYGYALLRQWAEAKADLDRGLLFEPGNVYFLTDRGGVKLFSGDIEGAIDDLSTAIERDEERAGISGAFLYRSHAYKKLGLDVFAADDARQAESYPQGHTNIFWGD